MSDTSCDCIKGADELLRQHNTQLVTNLFGPPRAFLATMKVDEKKRGKPKLLIASFCPLCGVAYPPRSRPVETGEKPS